MNRSLKFVLSLMVLALALAACGGANTPANNAPVANSGSSENTADVPDPTDPPTDEPVEPTEAQADTGDEGGEEETSVSSLPLGFDLGSPELKASDPARVNLSEGPQIVELFAFW